MNVTDISQPTCACGHHATGEPELDARTLPHEIRHAAILGSLDSLASGGTLVLIAPHDPLPLLAQIAQLYPDAFDLNYLQSGPDSWKLRFARR